MQAAMQPHHSNGHLNQQFPVAYVSPGDYRTTKIRGLGTVHMQVVDDTTAKRRRTGATVFIYVVKARNQLGDLGYGWFLNNAEHQASLGYPSASAALDNAHNCLN